MVKVLAMKGLSAAIAIATVLGGCKASESVASLRERLERADVSGIQSSVALVELPELKAIALLIAAGENGSVVTFSSADRRTISLQDGVLVRSAGFGNDLFYADPRPTLMAFSGEKHGRYSRSYHYLTEADRIKELKVDCEMILAGITSTELLGVMLNLRKFVETCHGKDVSLQNEYWLDASGSIRKSKEMVSPALGYANVELSIR